MGRQHGFEAYPRYQYFLQQNAVWPSTSVEATVFINDMVPRYASSALQKLLRWAESSTTGIALNISDQDQRVFYVRHTPLGLALAQRAQGLEAQTAKDPSTKVTPRDMILLFAPLIAEHTTLGIKAVFELAEELADKIDETWTVTSGGK